MNRRDFLKGASAAIVPVTIPTAIWGPAVAASTEKATATSLGIVPITAVVYDERYADCQAFADALASRGAAAFQTRGDAAQLWYGPLAAHLAKNPGHVAGLTTYADFSVSQACARELKFTQLYEGAHDARRSRTSLTHRLRTKADDREIAAAFSSELWATQLANALRRLPDAADAADAADEADEAWRTDGPRSATATTPRSFGHPGYLNSWLLSPAS